MNKEHICDAAWSIARSHFPSDTTKMGTLAQAIHGAVLNENRRCVNLVRDTERLSTGMATQADGENNPVKEMCQSLSSSMEVSFSYR